MMVPAAGDKDACLGGGPCVALLVLAHAAPSVLAVTARIFDDPRFRIYVHLDRKADLDAYCGGHVWPGRLCFIEERYEIFWGGFNMVRATEALARAALADASNAVCCLISDDALPLWPCDRVHEALVAVPDRIDLGMSRRNPPFLRRYTDFFFLDSRMTSARWLEVQERCVDPAGVQALERLERLRERGKYPFPEYWNGSQWWSLGRAVLESMLGELSGNPWLRASFEFSAVPDESAFHTLYANRLGLTARSFTGPMLTDATRVPSPFVFRSLAELPSIPVGKLFLRKVDGAAGLSMMRELQNSWSHG